MPTRTRAQAATNKRSASPEPQPQPASKKKNPPCGSESRPDGGYSDAHGTNSNVQSSIPGMSIAEIRAILGEQRKAFQENGYVDLTDEVCTGLSRYEFNYKYVFGIAVKRHAKHKRASARQAGTVEDN